MTVWTKLFFGFLLLLLLIEGLGLPNGHQISLQLTFLLTPLFLTFELVQKPTLTFPKNLTIAYLFFILFSLVSTFYSVNQNRSIEEILLYSCLFGLAIIAYNHQNELRVPLVSLIFIISFIFLFYAKLLQIGYNLLPLQLIPTSDYQLVISNTGFHNHLGDWLILPILISLYQFLRSRKKIYLYALILFIPALIIAYSRSAYLSLALALIITSFYFWKKGKLKFRSGLFWFFVVLVATLLTLTLAVVKEAEEVPILRNVNQSLTQNLGLGEKHFRAKRFELTQEAVSSIKERPWWGTGPGNFEYASKKYSQIKGFYASSAHNLFLNILAEHGILAFIAFFYFCLILVITSLKKPTIYLLLYLAILINFQTDYTFGIYSFLTMWFILGSVSLPSKQPS